MHTEAHPKAGQTVQVKFAGAGHPQIPASKNGPVEYVVEGWWDQITGRSWMFSDGNPAALVYAMRSGFSGLPTDDEVVYGKVGNFGHLVHVSEILVDEGETKR